MSSITAAAPGPTTTLDQPPTNDPEVEALPRDRSRRRFGVMASASLIAVSVLLIAKIVYRSPDSSTVLFAYGIAVTAVSACQIFVAMLLYRDPSMRGAPVAAAEGNPTRVTALVAVHNDEAVIEKCVRSLSAQTYPDTEIIVVNDASTDGTAAVLDRLASELPIHVIHLATNVGKKKALAEGLLQSRGDVFAFTDSDSTWSPDALARCVAALEHDPSIGAVSGHCRALNSDDNVLTRMQDSWYEGQFSIRKAFESHFGAVTCVSGPLAVFRREAVYNYIPAWTGDRFLGDEFRFATDRMMTGFVLMDRRHSAKVREKADGTPFQSPSYPHRNWRIEYCKSARSLTVVPDSVGRVVKQQVRWKKSFLRNLFFTGSFYWRRPRLPMLAFYFHVAFVLAGPFIAFRHIVLMPLHGSAESMLFYLAGILLMGGIFGLAFRVEDPENGRLAWYRPLMSIVSTLMLTWLIGYSIMTIKKMTWSRG